MKGKMFLRELAIPPTLKFLPNYSLQRTSRAQSADKKASSQCAARR
jgi:hypothetical protein